MAWKIHLGLTIEKAHARGCRKVAQRRNRKNYPNQNTQKAPK